MEPNRHPPNTPAPPRRRIGPGRKFVYTLILLAAFGLTVEAGFRVFYAFHVGPRVLLYGTPVHRRLESEAKRVHADGHTVMFHSNHLDGYSKYHPNEHRVDTDPVTGEVFPVTINGRGFRGPDFERRKAPGVIRVVTLGSSSTFGYSGRDDETYPHYLQDVLDARGDGAYEVLNLGIPHLTSGQIRSLYLAEVLPLAPDVVTFYEGVNDAADGGVARPTSGSSLDAWMQSIHGRLRNTFILASFAHETLTGGVTRYPGELLERHLEGRAEGLIANLTEIHEECRRRGILFIVMKQQARSYTIPRKEIRGITYAEEARRIRENLERTGELGRWELFFLTHQRLTDELERWSERERIPFVDIREALDQRRDVLYSWVHLSPEGNRMIAETLAAEIVERVEGSGAEDRATSSPRRVELVGRHGARHLRRRTVQGPPGDIHPGNERRPVDQ